MGRLSYLPGDEYIRSGGDIPMASRTQPIVPSPPHTRILQLGIAENNSSLERGG